MNNNRYPAAVLGVGVLLALATLASVARCQTAASDGGDVTREQYDAAAKAVNDAVADRDSKCGETLRTAYVNRSSDTEAWLAADKACQDARNRVTELRAAFATVSDKWRLQQHKMLLEEQQQKSDEYRAEFARAEEKRSRQWASRGGPALVREYERLLYRAFPDFNGIVALALVASGDEEETRYAIWGTHSFFSRYTFDIGPAGPRIHAWMTRNKKRLKALGIERVGVMGDSVKDQTSYRVE